jgi:hypothetical protein
MGTIIGWIALRFGVSPAIARAIATAGLFLAVLGVLGTAKCAYDRSVVAKHEAKIERRAAPATDQAASERSAETIAIAKNDQERHNVIAAQPDQPIAPTSRALACKRLHDAGRNPPACR